MSLSEKKAENLKLTPAELANRLAETLRAESDALVGEGNTADAGLKEYRLMNAILIQRIGAERVVYRMYSPGGEQPPEDVSGVLITDRGEFQGKVRRREAGTIHLEVIWPLAPASSIGSVVFRVNRKARLDGLAERIDRAAEHCGPLSVELFTPKTREGGGDAPASTFDSAVSFAGKRLGYVWTPPGSDQAVIIGNLAGDSLAAGKRLLVCTHSNRLLDEILEAIQNDPPETLEGVVRLGWTPCERLENSHSYGRRAEIDTQARTADEAEKRNRLQSVEARIQSCQKDLETLTRVRSLKRIFVEQETRLRNEHQEWLRKRKAVDRAEKEWLECRAELKKAQKAWFNKSARMQKAGRAGQAAAVRLGRAEAEVGLCRQEMTIIENRLIEVDEELVGLEAEVRGLSEAAALEKQRRALEKEKQALEEEIREISSVSEPSGEKAGQARAVFSTLNELCVSEAFSTTQFDTVIVAQAEAASMPQIFLAAGRAGQQMFLSGDFLGFSFQVPTGRQDDGPGWETLGPEMLTALARSGDPEISVIMAGARSKMPSPLSELAIELAYESAGLTFTGVEEPLDDQEQIRIEEPPFGCLGMADTAERVGWCGKEFQSLSPFNLVSALTALELAHSAVKGRDRATDRSSPAVLLVTPFSAQADLLTALIEDRGLIGLAAAGRPSDLAGAAADVVVFDSVLNDPIIMDRFADPDGAEDTKSELAEAVSLARGQFVLVGSSAWLDKRAKPDSALDVLWRRLKDRKSTYPMDKTGRPRDASYEITADAPDFKAALASATADIVGFLPFFDPVGWPGIEPVIMAALDRGVRVTLLDSLPAQKKDAERADRTLRALRRAGAVLIPTAGFQGREIIVDDRIILLDSGEADRAYVLTAPRTAGTYLRLLQAERLRSRATDPEGSPRSCPECGWPLLSSFQATRQGTSDPQPLKIKCINKKCKYSRSLDERLPYRTPPLCPVDGRTPYSRVRRGRGEAWQCPLHPKECPVEKVVPGDPA